MDLTPIRVRGRRKRKSMHDSNDGASPKNTPRPRKVARLNLAGLQALKTKKIRQDLNLSYIEQLPTELVQVIFEFCNNISLPMSSPILCGKLSHKKIYRRHAITMLETDGSQEDGTDNIADAAAVSRTLECRWMTWDMLKSAILRIHERALARAHVSSPSETTEEPTSEPTEPLTEVPPPNFNSPQEQGPLPYLNLHPSVQLPRKLLQGPWHEEKLHHLQYLIWSRCSIDWTSSSRGELATSGLQTAISTASHLAVALLLSPTVGVTPDTATLRTAILDHNCNPTIVFYILAAALRTHFAARAEGTVASVNFKDPAIWSWAGRAREAGNWKGKWVLDALRFVGDTAQRGGSWDLETWGELCRVVGRLENGVALLGSVPVTVEEIG